MGCEAESPNQIMSISEKFPFFIFWTERTDLASHLQFRNRIANNVHRQTNTAKHGVVFVVKLSHRYSDQWRNKMFGIGLYELLILLAIPAAGLSGLLVIYVVVRAATGSGNRDKNSEK